MTISTRLAMQGRIQDRFPDLIRQYTQELCTACMFAGLGFEGCGKGLLPVTLDGSRCFYFRQACGNSRKRVIAI